MSHCAAMAAAVDVRFVPLGARAHDADAACMIPLSSSPVLVTAAGTSLVVSCGVCARWREAAANSDCGAQRAALRARWGARAC